MKVSIVIFKCKSKKEEKTVCGPMCVYACKERRTDEDSKTNMIFMKKSSFKTSHQTYKYLRK